MNLTAAFLVAFAAAGALGPNNHHICPESQVWGGAKCESRELCFGSWIPPTGGHCAGETCPAGLIEVMGRCVSKPAEAECTGHTEFARHSNPLRCVVLSDGEPAELFERYVTDARQRRITIDYDRIRIIYFGRDNRQIEALGRPRTQAEKMIGISSDEVMRRRLHDAKLGHAARIGSSQKASIKGYDDMVCGGQGVTLVP